MKRFARFFFRLAHEVYGRKILFLISCAILSWSVPIYGKDTLSPLVAVVVSRNIRPYIEAGEGLRAALGKIADAEVRMFFLERSKDGERVDLAQKLADGKFDLFVAIGPDAARFVWRQIKSEGTLRLYCMILNPKKIFGPAANAHGISLNIPAQAQAEMIKRALPDIKRIGLLYDPAYNSGFFREAAEKAGMLGINMVPLEIHTKKNIPSVLKRHWKDMDAVWLIPDRTVISESIIQYVTKEAFFRKIAVIGYNRFFYESGATLAFVFDYRELGRECAQEAKEVLSGRAPRNIPPVFQVWVSGRVAGKLGLRIPESYAIPIMLGP